MNLLKTLFFSVLVLGAFSTQSVFSADSSINTVGVNGYDLITYHTEKRPLRGNGNYVAVHNKVTYLFSSEENKNKFIKNPWSSMS